MVWLATASPGPGPPSCSAGLCVAALVVWNHALAFVTSRFSHVHAQQMIPFEARWTG